MSVFHFCKDGDLPKKAGCYLCLKSFNGKIKKENLWFTVCYFSTDLYRTDKYDFYRYKGKHQSGWYDYDSDLGHYEIKPLAWMELPEITEEVVKKLGE